MSEVDLLLEGLELRARREFARAERAARQRRARRAGVAKLRSRASTLLAESATRERLSSERQECWSRICALIAEDGLRSTRTSREHRVLADRVRWITAALNGHSNDGTGSKSYTADAGGRYEQKRIDRMESEILLGQHDSLHGSPHWRGLMESA